MAQQQQSFAPVNSILLPSIIVQNDADDGDAALGVRLVGLARRSCCVGVLTAAA